MDTFISISMSELTLMISVVEEMVDCCSKNAAASAEVILDELFVIVQKILLMSSIGVVYRLLLCTGCQRAACSVIQKCMQESWIAFCADWVRLCTFVFFLNLMLFWLIWECQILKDVWKPCCCWAAPWKLLADKMVFPVFPNLPKQSNNLYLMFTIYLFSPNFSLSEYQIYCNTFVPLVFGFT